MLESFRYRRTFCSDLICLNNYNLIIPSYFHSNSSWFGIWLNIIGYLKKHLIFEKQTFFKFCDSNIFIVSSIWLGSFSQICSPPKNSEIKYPSPKLLSKYGLNGFFYIYVHVIGFEFSLRPWKLLSFLRNIFTYTSLYNLVPC